MGIAALVTWLLVIGTRESAAVNAVLVGVKVTALAVFIALAVPVIHMDHFTPFAPLGFGGISAAAASIFFAYVGFDAVSTAAEETENPQRNMPIGLIGSLAICTVFYLLVAMGVIGSVGAQPVAGPTGEVLSPGSLELARQCAALSDNAVVCSKEALAWTLRSIGWPQIGNLIGLAAGLALPSVILMMMFGQTRIFFVMSRDGLLPQMFSKIHPRFHTPHVVTVLTGAFVALFAGFFPVGKLADVSNSGTLFAFAGGVDRGAGIAPHRPPASSPVPHARHQDHRAARDCRLRVPVFLARLRHPDDVRGVGRGRLVRVFLLQPQPQLRGPRHHRCA